MIIVCKYCGNVHAPGQTSCFLQRQAESGQSTPVPASNAPESNSLGIDMPYVYQTQWNWRTKAGLLKLRSDVQNGKYSDDISN